MHELLSAFLIEFTENSIIMQTRVLVVDDEPDCRNILKLLLIQNSYHVDSAADGVEALKVIENYQPHIVITDVTMPRMDGIELAGKMSMLNMDIPAIICSGGDLEELEERTNGNQLICNIIKKPVERAALLRAIENAIDNTA